MGGVWVILLNVEFGGLFQKWTMFCECMLYINMVSNANKVGLALITMPYLGRFAVSWEWRTISERKSVVYNITQNMIFSVWLYLVLLPPYHVQHLFFNFWQLVLNIRASLHYGGEVHWSWKKGRFSIVIGQKCNSWPVGVYTRWRKQWWWTFLMDDNMTWPPTWRHFLELGFSGGGLSCPASIETFYCL